MPDTEHVRHVIREWTTKAENDLLVARYLLDMGAGCPADIVCFHAQQCVEKYIKAAIVRQGLEVPKTHDIERLANLTASQVEVSLSPAEMRLLAGYAVEQRYPGYGPVTPDEAHEAVGMAEKVQKAIQSLLGSRET